MGIEEGVHLPALGFGERLPSQQLNACVAEGGEDVVAKCVRMLSLELVRALPDVLEDLARGQPAGSTNRDAGRDPPLEPRDPHHEELVEVAREDGEELRALEAGKVLVLGKLEHSLVESQPRKFTVKESICRQALSLHGTMLPQGGERSPYFRGAD
ncbi:unannotated protein [freshwater metagenome]|uniref:Unannotated protein n=1 Tax=freshwater metagenome TaxID=449393 RepID=A0A6J7HLY0_9ZZZZ